MGCGGRNGVRGDRVLLRERQGGGQGRRCGGEGDSQGRGQGGEGDRQGCGRRGEGDRQGPGAGRAGGREGRQGPFRLWQKVVVPGLIAARPRTPRRVATRDTMSIFYAA